MLFHVSLAAAAAGVVITGALSLVLGLARPTASFAAIVLAALPLAIAASFPVRRMATRAWEEGAGRLGRAAERASRNLAVLADTGAELSRSFHVESALSRVAGRTVPSFADWCTIHLSQGGALKLVAVVESGEQQVATSSYPEWVARAVATGRPEQMASSIVVPLGLRGTAYGAVSFGLGDGRRFGPQDLVLAESLAARIALALENEKLHREARDTGRRTDELLGNISHDLRTPLNAIVGWATMLQSDKLDASMRQRAIETIDRNARLQARIIEDILDASRLVAGKLQIEMQPVELASVVTAALGVARSEASAKEIHLRTTIDPDVSLVSGDPLRLRQVVTNLVSRAIKATPKHGEIDVSVTRSNGNAEVVVRDNGAGIDTEVLARVFERFPLEIVRHLVELHGGRIEANSAGRGRGATFRVTLPLRAA